jgi:adenine-specific DNA-methyltransferase
MFQSSSRNFTENHQKLLQFNSLAESFSRDLLGEVDLVRITARSKQKQKEMIEGEVKTLSPGGQNVLIEKIINEFAPRFTPGGKLVYVGDTDEKFAHFNEAALLDLGVTVDSHGKMPDVIIHHLKNNWLVLIEAVTSHGPINPKRKKELETIFANTKIPLVMVTTFLSRKAIVEYLAEIAWETDVWVAEDATHLIHFNGEYLLQTYKLDKSDTE